MSKKSEKGETAIDIAVSIVIFTIFISMIANIILNTNLNKTKIKRKSEATSYAISEIEKIRGKGYNKTENDYDGKGIKQEDVLEDEDIYNNNEFTGYHKKVTIKDYSLIQKENNPNVENNITSDIVKKITVEISYKLSGKDENITLVTYVAK